VAPEAPNCSRESEISINEEGANFKTGGDNHPQVASMYKCRQKTLLQSSQAKLNGGGANTVRVSQVLDDI